MSLSNQEIETLSSECDVHERIEQINTESVPSEQESTESAESAESAFHQLGLNDDLTSAVESFGYTTPTPIQEKTIPLLLEGRDVLGQAQTGTGKTAAFALPLLQRIDLFNKRPQVLVLTPTRELAIQVAASFEKYAKGMNGLRVVPIYGGQDIHIQNRLLSRGSHVVVGTPGRVMDHMRRGSLKLSEMQCLVLDEADEMLRMGFADDVEWVLTQSPEKRQIALFSATMPPPIRKIAQKHLSNPSEIIIKQERATADTVRQRYIVSPPRQKQATLLRILEAEPIDAVLVFVKMRSTTEPVAEYLAQAGFKTAALNGDIVQKQRERTVSRLRAGKIDIIVATDVAARGLDVQRISHVINYDLPHDSEAYVHRIGRTGRAGRSGEAILFVHPNERKSLERLEYAMRHKIDPMELPSNRDINQQRVSRFHEKITEALASKELDTFQSIVNQYQRENDVPVEMIAAALAVLANQETPLIVKDKLKRGSFSQDSDRQRGAKNAKKREFQKGRGRTQEGMETYRIEVGKTHKVLPGNIVGAIANEAGIDSDMIGKIKIFDQFTAVDLPENMPSDILETLQEVSVAGQKLKIKRMGDTRPRPASKRPHSGKRPFKKSKKKTKNRKKFSPK